MRRVSIMVLAIFTGFVFSSCIVYFEIPAENFSCIQLCSYLEHVTVTNLLLHISHGSFIC